MNNFTLTFHSEQLEQQYQNSRETTRKVIFLGILGIIIINNSLKLILDAINEIDTNWYIQLAIVIVASVGMMLFQTLKPCMHYCLILMNYLCLSEYVQLDSSYNLHQAYAKGMNIMVIHIMILIGTEFKHCLHQIVFITLIRIALSFMLNQQFAIQQYFLCLSLIVAQIIAFYCFNLALRRQFLLRLRENQLEQFIPIVIKQPFYFFEYKNYQFQLIKTNSNLQHCSQVDLYMDYCEGCRFRQMLRNYKIQTMTFEQFILSRINQKNQQQYSQQELEIQTNYKTKQLIQLSELFTEKTQFLIVFNSHVTDLDSYMQIKEYYNKFQQFMLNHISNTYKILKLPKNKIIKNLIRLNLSCTSGLVFQQQTMKYFDALKVLRVLKNIVNANVYLLAKQPEIVINTYKILFIVAFYQIMEILSQLDDKVTKKIILLIVSNQQCNQNYLQITLSLSQPNNFIQRYKENSILRRMESILFNDIIMEQNFIIKILDLGFSVPYQKPYQSNKLIIYEDAEEQVSLMS